jgi:hypothetical protein
MGTHAPQCTLVLRKQFQSHQIFHLMVIVAAFVHYHGITEVAYIRLSAGSCAEQLAEKWPDVYAQYALPPM